MSQQLDTEVKFLSDQRTRGISDSLMQPAVKLSLNYAHASGLVALAELVTVSKKSFPAGDGLDLTLAGGYRFGDPDAWHFGVGAAAEIFPGAQVNAPHQIDLSSPTGTADTRATSFNSRFAVLEIGYGALEGRIMRVLSPTYRGADTGTVCGGLLQFAPDQVAALTDPGSKVNQCYARGEHNSRGTMLYDLNYKIALNPITNLSLHAGYQNVANFSEANFSDYGIGINHKRWGFDWSANWVFTRVRNRELYLVQDGENVRETQKSAVIVAVSRKF